MSDGELFSRVYLRAGEPAVDNLRFRNRLYGYLWEVHSQENSWYSLSNAIRRAGGLDITGSGKGFDTFFKEAPIKDVLDFITLYWRFLGETTARESYFNPHPVKWHAFVGSALAEENVGYRIDAKCGVHYFVDEEFERNRVSALAGLDAAPLQAVKSAFESAHRYLDPGSRDTKASVRSAFEALEILAVLTYPDQARLTRNLVLQRLRPDVQARAPDDIARKAIGAAFDGVGDIVDGAHEYRHGQRVEETVAPPLDYALFFLSTIAAAIRYVIPVWAAKQINP